MVNASRQLLHENKVEEFKRQFKSTLSEVRADMSEIREHCAKKLSIEEGQEIWANFSKFTVYDDLKDLYNRCLPAIGSCEEKLAI